VITVHDKQRIVREKEREREKRVAITVNGCYESEPAPRVGVKLARCSVSRASREKSRTDDVNRTEERKREREKERGTE